MMLLFLMFLRSSGAGSVPLTPLRVSADYSPPLGLTTAEEGEVFPARSFLLARAARLTLASLLLFLASS